MKKLVIATMAVLALGSSVAFAEGGGDRTFERSAEHMKVAMDAYNAQHAQVATSGQVDSVKVNTSVQK